MTGRRRLHGILLRLSRVDTMRSGSWTTTAVQDPRPVRISTASLCAGVLALALVSCSRSGSPPSYTLTAATPLGTITAGKAANVMLWLTPQNGYAGTVSLSCAVKSDSTPPPTCVLSAPSISVNGAPVFSNLTVSSALSTPGGSYSVTVSAHDASLLIPSNGPLTLPLLMSAVLQHIVIIFQEHRTPDNLFQDPVLIGRGADIKSSGVNSLGQTIPLAPIDLGTTGTSPQNYDLSDAHAAFVAMYDGGKMDGADLIACSPAANCPPNAHPNPQFMYVKPADVQPYFALAEQYTFGDRMFQTNQGPSFPAHQFIIAGTSAPTASSPLFAAENPALSPAGCIASALNTVAMVDASGSETAQPPQYPCFDHPTLTDLLTAHKVGWRYYAPSAGSISTGPDAIDHICAPQTVNGTLTCMGSEWTANVIIPQTQVLTDILNGQLVQVSWVIPDGMSSDHAVANDGSGPSWVASIVNAIGNSPYWANTAIIITWDDWGGWYDHVPPTVVNDGVSWGSGYVYGFRVPLIVVSPYAKTAYVSHVTHDFGSILKFIEATFNLPSLGYADARADDLSDCFNLTQTPSTFHSVTASLDAAFFINDHRPAVAPDED
jgi:phospholipase C